MKRFPKHSWQFFYSRLVRNHYYDIEISVLFGGISCGYDVYFYTENYIVRLFTKETCCPIKHGFLSIQQVYIIRPILNNGFLMDLELIVR